MFDNTSSYRKRGRKCTPLNDLESSFYLTIDDHLDAQMVSDKLVGESNYGTWANAMRISLVARRKLPFIFQA